MKHQMVEMMAKKAFESEAFQRSWRVHAQAFAPLLDEAFSHSCVARVHLTNALNHLSRREVAPAFEKLKALEEVCSTDADHAAWCFFVGLGYELLGRAEDMCTFYRQANAYGHGFYMPYMKVAKMAHDDGMHQVAAKDYLTAALLLEKRRDAATTPALAACYLGCAASHVMMHQLSEAEAFLQRARDTQPDSRGSAGIAALLHAARGEADAAQDMLAAARRKGELAPDLEAMVRGMVQGTHPHFAAQPVLAHRIPLWWQRLAEQLETIERLLRAERGEEVFAMMSPQLQSIFPTGMDAPDYGLYMGERGLEVTLCHRFSRTLQAGYEALLAACPEELRARVKFTLEA